MANLDETEKWKDVTFTKEMSIQEYCDMTYLPNDKTDEVFSKNKTVIISKKIKKDKKLLKESELNANTLLPVGTVIQVIETVSLRGENTIVYIDAKKSVFPNVFFPSDVSTYLKNKTITREFEFGGNKEQYLKTTNDIYIAVYSKVLGKIIYLSNYCYELKFGNGKSGGNFTISLSNPACEKDEQAKEFKMINVLKSTGGLLTKNSLLGFLKNKNTYRSYFEKVLSTQDLIFIKINEDFKTDFSSLKNILSSEDFNMIGLIDSVKLNTVQNNDSIESSVEIQGKDLSKVLIEDGTDFNPVQSFIGGVNDVTKDSIRSIIGGNFIEDEIETLMRIYGKLDDEFFIKSRGLKELTDKIIKFISKVTWGYKEVLGLGTKGIWDLISIEVEPFVGARQLYDSSMQTMKGSLMSFLKKIYQEPFCDIFTETIGNKYRIYFRTNPFTREGIKDLLDNAIEIPLSHIISENTGTDLSEIYSFYSLTPHANCFGGEKMKFINLQALCLVDMLKTYGVKSFKAENTYLQFSSSVTDKNEIIDLNQQSAQDLKIMTEATMLNPFLKKGTMTLSNIYNLKRGVGIVIPELNMFYYVESYNYNCTPGKITVNVNISFGLPMDKIDFFFDMIKMEPNKKTNKLDITYNHERFEQLRKKDY